MYSVMMRGSYTSPDVVENTSMIAFRNGIYFAGQLENHGFDLEKAQRLVYLRNGGITQLEASRIFDISRDKIQEVERVLKNAGVEIANHSHGHSDRKKRMEDHFNILLSGATERIALRIGGVL